jgi:sulfur carrier protein
MEILVNGEAQQVNASQLDAVLLEMAFNGKFAVALNGEFVPRSLYAQTQLSQGDSLEVLSPIAGG